MGSRPIGMALLTVVMVSVFGIAERVRGQAPAAPDPATTIFLDNAAGVENGGMTYDPATRSCGAGKYRVFSDVGQAAAALKDAAVLYVRAGTYSRVVTPHVNVHDSAVNYWEGALAIGASGTPEKHKLVSAYRGEEVIIQAKPGVSEYNPDPNDQTFKKSSHFYPNPAISVGGAYVDVSGFKTFGQAVISGHDVVLERCDLGGGGPHMNQGQVVALNSNRAEGVYNAIVRNNRIHHSCWGESPANGAALMCYCASFIVENNEFYDNYGADICLKDTKRQQGRTTILRYNFFRPSSIHHSTGIKGIAQGGEIDRVLMHNNVFYQKVWGIAWDGPAMKETIAYNNTFVDCGVDIGHWQKDDRVNIFNNLHYHTQSSGKYLDIQHSEPGLDNLQSDFSLFCSKAGGTAWLNLYRSKASALADWQKYSGKDAHSVEKDPGFVNPTGNRPEDFKRKDPKNIKDVEGSKYGPVCGAYVTDDEKVGIDWADTTQAVPAATPAK